MSTENDYVTIRITQVESSNETHPVPFALGLLCVVGTILAASFIGIKVICLMICSV